MLALWVQIEDKTSVKFTNIRIPVELWERCKANAKVMKKSGAATAMECISDCMDQMDAPAPGVPAVVQTFFLRKPAPLKKAKKEK